MPDAAASPSSRSFVWRLPAPFFLLLALTAYPLPWVRVETGVVIDQSIRDQSGTVHKIGDGEKKLVPDGEFVLTGLRVAFGPYFERYPGSRWPDSAGLHWSMANALVPLLLMGIALVLGLLLPNDRLRRVVVAGCALVALLLLLFQTFAHDEAFSSYVQVEHTGWVMFVPLPLVLAILSTGVERWWTARPFLQPAA